MKKTLVLVGVYALPFFVLAQTIGSSNPFLGILGKISALLNAVIPIVITLALIYFIYGVAKYVTAHEEESKTEARDVMIYGAIGLFFIVSNWGIVNLLVQFTGTGGISTTPVIPSVTGGFGGSGSSGGSFLCQNFGLC